LRTLPAQLALVALAVVAAAAAPADDLAPRSEPEPVPAAVTSPAPEAPTTAAAEALAAPAPLALWVLAEGSQRVLENPERIPALLADARALGASDLFVQVYRRGVAWWPSERVRPAEAWSAARAARPGTGDPLAELLAAAHAAGLRVHAWINVLSLADNREAAVLAVLGPAALHVDRKGRSVLDYPEGEMPAPEAPHLRMGTPAVWLDPAAPGLAEWYGGLVAELFARYPALDGLHLDYLRYPDVLPFSPGSRFGVGMDFGYGEASRARFREATGFEAPADGQLDHANEWDDWRRGQVTALLARMREAVRGAAPEAALSAAVFPHPERAYLSVHQDWLGWLEAGLLEFAVPMLYTRDERLLRYQAAAFAGGIEARKVWAGLGAWLFREEPATAVAQLETVRRLGVAGHALFSWDSIADAPSLRAALAEEAARVARR
jgi:uncharacterized lipoprotein YddW (UPF0748 family)